MVRVAHAEPRLEKFLVVLADDAGHRALPAWVAQEPGLVSLPDLLDRPADDIWTTASIPEELAVRLLDAVGGNVTGVEIYPVTTEPGEVNSGTCAARIELGAGQVTARLDQGLTLAVVAGAPVRVDGAMMDRLGVPVPADDPAAPFRSSADGPGHDVIARREGHVRPGARPRFEPRNTTFADGLDRWQLDGGDDYSAATEGSAVILSSAVAKPSGSAAVLQTVFADEFHGAPVRFRGEFRTQDVAGQAGLCLRILAKGWQHPGRVEERVVTAGSRDWGREEISAWVPEGTDIIQFGIILTGSGRVWLRNPDLRRGDA
jgi:hypothetical protein